MFEYFMYYTRPLIQGQRGIFIQDILRLFRSHKEVNDDLIDPDAVENHGYY